MTISAEFIHGVIVGFTAACAVWFIVVFAFQMGKDWQQEHPDPPSTGDLDKKEGA